MSYVDPHRSGTTFGVVEFNDVFAPNTSIDWGTIASDLDTLICKVPYDDADGNPLNSYHLLTAYKDGSGDATSAIDALAADISDLTWPTAP